VERVPGEDVAIVGEDVLDLDAGDDLGQTA
jgi:hypothetical protein